MHEGDRGCGGVSMIEITAWKCKWCDKLFRTPDRHRCKKNPALKNCFSCKHLMGWSDAEELCVGESPWPCCAIDTDNRWDWDIENIKYMNYNMQCEGWEEGKYDWEKRWKDA